MIVYGIILLLASWGVYCRLKQRSLPPGPPRLPLIGNLHQISTRYPWKQMQQWHRLYGPIITVQAGQMTLIVLGTHDVAKELLSRRSSNYSSRPRLVVAQECLAKGFGSALLPYSPIWKKNHAIQLSLLNARRCELYRPLQELESLQLLYNILSGNDFRHELHRYSSSLIFTLLYGKRLITGHEPELQEIEHLSSSIVGAVSFGNWLVDAFPVLNYIPSILAKWKRVGDDFHQKQFDLYSRNANSALNTSAWNWTKETAHKSETSLPWKDLTFVLGEIFEAGSHTTAGALVVAVLACISYPACMRRAQEELDEAVGKHMPTFQDIQNLPYGRAFVEEVLRWRPLAPGGVPHSPIKDDSFNGYDIPKGAAVVANHWSLEMDQEIFHAPEKFMPERWIDNSDLPSSAFGFGRRSCPGQHLARNSLLLVIPRLLWTFDIKWKSNQALELDQLEMTHEGIFSKPCHFEADFKVRSLLHQQMLLRCWHERTLGFESTLDEIGARF